MRQIRRYRHLFVHPRYPDLVDIRASGCTPCEARGEAYVLLEAKKHREPALPQDSEWQLYQQMDCDLLGVLGDR